MVTIREVIGKIHLLATLVPVPQAAEMARVFVRHRLICLGCAELIDDACQIVSEMVANAVEAITKDDPTARGSIRLYLGLHEGHPLLEVWDSSSEMPVLKEPDYLAESGRGLHIIQSLAAHFGWREDERQGGKIVWALLNGSPTPGTW